jgi:hypothetical protein
MNGRNVKGEEGTAATPACQQGQAEEAGCIQQQEGEFPTKRSNCSKGWTTEVVTAFAQENNLHAQGIATIESGPSRNPLRTDSLLIPPTRFSAP